MSVLASAAFAAEAPIEIDPNTKTQGGADVRGSDASAGERSDSKLDIEKQPAAGRGEVVLPDKENIESDKPISARKPREQDREPDNAAKGESSK